MRRDELGFRTSFIFIFKHCCLVIILYFWTSWLVIFMEFERKSIGGSEKNCTVKLLEIFLCSLIICTHFFLLLAANNSRAGFREGFSCGTELFLFFSLLLFLFRACNWWKKKWICCCWGCCQVTKAGCYLEEFNIQSQW